mmetsp:Transcript_28815/g.45391  ORF Transcript_28815/g.45391 Transcript_28815/m.45391 type:complete len:104 (+) Transcript_28815:275-586(+)
MVHVHADSHSGKDQLQVGDCKAYHQEEDNMARRHDIDEVVEEDKVSIDILVEVVVALFGHQEFDSYWTHHLLLHQFGIGLVLDSFDVEEEDMENSMEESSSLD